MKEEKVLKFTPLTGTWHAQCEVCGQVYENHCGSTACCGSIAFLVKKDENGNWIDDNRCNP